MIYPRGKNKKYVADFHQNGTHGRKALHTTNKKIATSRAVQLEQSLENNEFETLKPTKKRSQKAVGLAEGVKEFLAYSTAEGLRRRSITKQRGILQRFTDFVQATGVHHLADVDLRSIDSYRASRKPALSPKSMHNEGQLLKQFFSWCAERLLINRNPLALRRFQRPKYSPKPSPSLCQVNAILKEASAIRFPVLALLAFTGTRSGEAAHLQIQDIDFDGNWIHFVSREGFETKTGESRKVPIHPHLRPELVKAIGSRKSGWVFTALPSRKFPNGDHHISTKHLNNDFLKVLKTLNIPSGQNGGFTVHSLRRAFKTICVNANIPREVVDVWQGHARVRAASDLYYSLSDEDSQKFMKLTPFSFQRTK